MILKEELEKLNLYNKEKLNNKLDDIDNLYLKSYVLGLLELKREETIREVENILDNYFKGLIIIPMPELTLNKIKQSLYKLKK